MKAATGEVVTAEDLGGADVHAKISGVADHLANDDTHALAIARRIVGTLNSEKIPDIPLREPRAAALRSRRARRHRPADAGHAI